MTDAQKSGSWRANARFAADIVNTLALPIVTVAATILGLYATNSLREREIEIARQNNLQSLRNQREQSETALRSALTLRLNNRLDVHIAEGTVTLSVHAMLRARVEATHDEAAGEDVAQEVMTRLYAGWAAIERPEAYLRTAIVNTAVNWRRRQTTSRIKLPLVSRPEAVDPVDTDRSAELADALAGLPERQRAVLVLRYWAGLSEAEIADTLGCRPGTVKSLASRALNRLSKELPR